MSRQQIVRWLRRTGACAILDGSSAPGPRLVRMAAELRRGGIRIFQLRLKLASDREVVHTARALKRSLPGCAVLVNDRCDLARAGGADGVHVGQDDLPVRTARRLLRPGSLVGVSAGTPGEVGAAAGGHPDYISLGPAFATGTKRDAGRPLGPGGIRRLRELLPPSMPVLAVGGITQDNAGDLIRAGVQAVAIASWWWRQRDPRRSARELADRLKAWKVEWQHAGMPANGKRRRLGTIRRD